MEGEAQDAADSEGEVHSEEEDGVPVAFKRRANGMPTPRYNDEQMDALMKLIVEKRAYFKAARRGAEPPIRAKWDMVATAFLAKWPSLRPLMGPGLHKYYRTFAAAFVEFVHAGGPGHSPTNLRLNDWQTTLLKLEEQRARLSPAPTMRTDVVDLVNSSSPGRSSYLEPSNSVRPPAQAQQRQTSSQTESQAAVPVDIQDLVRTLQEYTRRLDQVSSVREEETRLQYKAREEENQIRRIEAEARLLEARNRERELTGRTAAEGRLIELMGAVEERLQSISALLERIGHDADASRQ